tara:strand:- start:340 stop:918 length:579 start_codon:yes stop_codon:yes gene_type:complete
VWTLARILSIVGHPLVIVPAGVLAKLAIDRFIEARTDVVVVVGLICVATATFSLWQVKRGAWVDLDASASNERKTLVFALASGLIGVSAVLFLLGAPIFLSAGLASAALIVMSALLLARWCKLSLHTAFAVYAGLFLSPHVFLVLSVLVLAMLIGWSRLVLERHSIADVVSGYVVGLVSGMAYIAAPALMVA